MNGLPDTDDQDQSDAAGFFSTGNKPEKAPKRTSKQLNARRALAIPNREAEGEMRDPSDMKKKLAGAMGMMQPELEGVAAGVPAAIEAAPIIGSAAGKAAAGMGRGDFLKGLGAAGAATAVAGPKLVKGVASAAKAIPNAVAGLAEHGIPEAEHLVTGEAQATSTMAEKVLMKYNEVLKALEAYPRHNHAAPDAPPLPPAEYIEKFLRHAKDMIHTAEHFGEKGLEDESDKATEHFGGLSKHIDFNSMYNTLEHIFDTGAVEDPIPPLPGHP